MDHSQTVPLTPRARPFEPQSKVIFGRFRQLLAINAHKMAPRTSKRLQERAWDALVREPASSGPLYLAPVSPKSSKNTRFGREKRMFFELFADTGAKQRGPELAGSLISPHEEPFVAPGCGRGCGDTVPLLSHAKCFQSRFAEVNSPHKSVDLSSTITNTKKRLTNFCGILDQQNDLKDSLCETSSPPPRATKPPDPET